MKNLMVTGDPDYKLVATNDLIVHCWRWVDTALYLLLGISTVVFICTGCCVSDIRLAWCIDVVKSCTILNLCCCPFRFFTFKLEKSFLSSSFFF